MIRDPKDIPTIMVNVQIPQPDYTEEERVYYEKKMYRQLLEHTARNMGGKIVTDENGDHLIIEKKNSIIDDFLGIFGF